MSTSEVNTWHYRKLWLLIGWFWIVAIWYLSLSSEITSIDLGVTFTDKLLHAGAYGVLTAWFMQLYQRRDSRVTCVIAFVGMGVILEYLQSMTVYRQFEYIDMLANTLGVFSAWIIVRGKLSQALLRMDTLLHSKS